MKIHGKVSLNYLDIWHFSPPRNNFGYNSIHAKCHEKKTVFLELNDLRKCFIFLVEFQETVTLNPSTKCGLHWIFLFFSGFLLCNLVRKCPKTWWENAQAEKAAKTPVTSLAVMFFSGI